MTGEQSSGLRTALPNGSLHCRGARGERSLYSPAPAPPASQQHHHYPCTHSRLRSDALHCTGMPIIGPHQSSPIRRQLQLMETGQAGGGGGVWQCRE